METTIYFETLTLPRKTTLCRISEDRNLNIYCRKNSEFPKRYLSALTYSRNTTGVRKVWNKWEFYLLFTLYALYVLPDTIHIFSAAVPCFARILLNILGSTVAQQSVILCLRWRRSRILTAYTRAFRNPENAKSPPFHPMLMPFLVF
jgi:hypothetical protein